LCLEEILSEVTTVVFTVAELAKCCGLPRLAQDPKEIKYDIRGITTHRTPTRRAVGGELLGVRLRYT